MKKYLFLVLTLTLGLTSGYGQVKIMGGYWLTGRHEARADPGGN